MTDLKAELEATRQKVDQATDLIQEAEEIMNRQLAVLKVLAAALRVIGDSASSTAESWGRHEFDYSSEWIAGFETALDMLAVVAREALRAALEVEES